MKKLPGAGHARDRDCTSGTSLHSYFNLPHSIFPFRHNPAGKSDDSIQHLSRKISGELFRSGPQEGNLPCQAGCGEMTPERYGGEIRRIPLRFPMFPAVFRHRPEPAAGHRDRKADFLTEPRPEADRLSFSEIPDCAK